MASEAPHGLSADTRRQLHEIADLMDDIYTTLAMMQYIPAEAIQRAPHRSPPVDVDLAAKLHLDPSIIYLHQILPYIDDHAVEATDFIFGGYFVDFRDAGDVERSRDPFYMDDDSCMKPWVTTLSALGNHQSVILYDARLNRIWIIDQECWDSTDPRADEAGSIVPVSDDGESGEGGSGGDGDGEGDGDGDGREQENSFYGIKSRPAPDVLRDIKRWYVELERLPGGGENAPMTWQMTADKYGYWDSIPAHLAVPERDDIKQLYRKHGWPDNFNAAEFNADWERLDARCSAVYGAEEPIRKVDEQRGVMEWAARHLDGLKNKVNDAKDLEAKYAAEWEVKKFEITRQAIARSHQAQKETLQKEFPDGGKLTYEVMLLEELEELEGRLDRAARDVQDGQRRKEDMAPKEVKRLALREVQHTRVKAAYDKCLAEVGQRELTRLPKHRREQQSLLHRQAIRREARTYHIPAMQEYLDSLPADAIKARERVQSEIDRQLRQQQDSLEKDRRGIKFQAEHGEPIPGYETEDCLAD